MPLESDHSPALRTLPTGIVLMAEDLLADAARPANPQGAGRWGTSGVRAVVQEARRIASRVQRGGVPRTHGAAAGSGGRPDPLRFVRAIGITAICTLVSIPVASRLDPVNVAMVFLLGTTVAALRLGRGPSALCAIGNVAAFDFLFVPPRYSFYIADTQYLITLGVMLSVALVVANLVVSIRHRTEEAAARERHTAALYSLSRDLAGAADESAIAASATTHLAAAFGGAAFVFTAHPSGKVATLAASGGAAPETDETLTRWLSGRDDDAAGTAFVGHYMVLALERAGATRHVLAAVWLRSTRPPAERERLFEAFASQTALALERARHAEAAADSRAAAERAALRNTLLASISHDLRGPLATIAGAGSIVAQASGTLDDRRRATLGRLIEQKAQDMNALLSNVLDLLRLESGTAPVKADWQSLDDLISTSLKSHERQLSRWRITIDVAEDFPLLYVDASLMVQLVSNLFTNAARHTPPGTQLHIHGQVLANGILVLFDDDGPGFGDRDPERLFEKFERGAVESSVTGVGLGLAICRCIATLHGGGIRALNLRPHGARFEVRLPLSRAQRVDPPET